MKNVQKDVDKTKRRLNKARELKEVQKAVERTKMRSYCKSKVQKVVQKVVEKTVKLMKGMEIINIQT